MSTARIHPSAHVSPEAILGEGAQVWHNAQVRERARVGKRTIVGQGAYVDLEVEVGDDCKLQNYACVYAGVTLENGVFVGPHATFTNDLHPRAIRPDGGLKGTDDWVITKTLVKTGAAIGANSTIVCGTTIGRWALVAAGSVVTRDVPDHGLVRGAPARLVGFVSAHGHPMKLVSEPAADADHVDMVCPVTGTIHPIPMATYRAAKI